MAVKIENHCVDCGQHCKGDLCPNRNVEVCYCDNCDEMIAFDDVYFYEGMDVCENCLKALSKKEW